MEPTSKTRPIILVLLILVLAVAAIVAVKYVWTPAPSSPPVGGSMPPPVVTPTPTSTAPTFGMIGPGSAPGTSLFAYTGTPAFQFSASGTISDFEGAMGPLLATLDLGTAVENPGTKFAPGRTLEIYVVSKDDEGMNGCYFSGQGWQNGISPGKSVTTINNQTFCVTTSTDAGAGNRYNVKTYALPVGDRVVVFEFIVHSVACENYSNPAAQCFAYDEARDMSGFEGIMQTLAVQ
jgi:hypothetical protein